jgi:hypothetical protein
MLRSDRLGARVGLVLGGYVAALLLAFFAVWLNGAFADPADGSASAGMQSFGDFLLFIGVFVVAAAFPTALGIFFIMKPGQRAG